MDKKEIRSFESTLTIEKREDGSTKIIGHAAVFNSMSEKLGWFQEKILPGAFDNVLEDDVRALFNHDSNIVLGRTKAKTLAISVDEKGLRYDIEPPDTQAARDLMISIERGDVSQSSFGFQVARDGDEWDEDEKGDAIRIIKKIKRLWDVSPVTFPAYPETDVAKRSHDQFKQEHKPEKKFNYELYKSKVSQILTLKSK